MTLANRRILIVGGALLAVIATVVVAGVLLQDGSKDGTSNSSSPSPQATDIRVEVEQAYLAFWDAYAQSLLNLDAAPLERVTAEQARDHFRGIVEDQQRKGRPVRVSVVHNYRITIVDSTNASVDDTFVSHTVELDRETREPIEPVPNTTVRQSYTLKRIEGSWKIVFVIGYQSPSP